MSLSYRIICCALLPLSAIACNFTSDDPDYPELECRGEERCGCYPNGTCNASLSCISSVCVDLKDHGLGGGGATSTCEQGRERCECFPNATCFDDLSCRSGLCVDLSEDMSLGGGPGQDDQQDPESAGSSNRSPD